MKKWLLALVMLIWTSAAFAAPSQTYFVILNLPVSSHIKDIDKLPRNEREKYLIKLFLQAAQPINQEILSRCKCQTFPLWSVQTLLVSGPIDQFELQQIRGVRSVLLDGPLGRGPQVVDARSLSFDGPPPEWAMQAIHLDVLRAREPALNGDKVRVGVLDTGVDATHPALQGRVGLFKDFVNGKAAPYDDQGHGTIVSGIIAGQRVKVGQKEMTLGVAPKATLIVGKIFDNKGHGLRSHILIGMQWVLDPDGNPDTEDFPHVVNNSWGTTLDSTDPYPLMNEELNYRMLETWKVLEVLPVFAAGNRGDKQPIAPNGIPAGLPAAVSVGATTVKNLVANFSLHGPNLWETGDHRIVTIGKPDLVAPGENVFSCSPGGKFITGSATSFSAPFVTGAAAILWQAYPKLFPNQVRDLLFRSAQDLAPPGPDAASGNGLLDVNNAVRLLRSRIAQKTLVR